MKDENKETSTTENEVKVPKNAKYKLEVEGKVGYLKRLPRHVLEQALGLITPVHGTPKIITAGELILNSCWIKEGSDEEIRDDEDLFIEACMQCVTMIERKQSSLAKL